MKKYKDWFRYELITRREPQREGFQQGAWYFWENKHQTVPVKARQYLGITDDRAYMLVEGSNTGIPIDECRILAKNMWPAMDKRLEGFKEYPGYPAP